MLRLAVIVLLSIVLAAPIAHAFSVRPCTCAKVERLPASGSIVTSNARVWVLAHGEIGSSTVATARAGDPDFQIMTLEEVDVIPPSAPRELEVMIMAIDPPAEAPKLNELIVRAHPDADTAFLRVVIDDDDPQGQPDLTLYVAPDGRHHCSDPHIAVGYAQRVTVTAIDLAGNESEPVTAHVVTRIRDASGHPGIGAADMLESDDPDERWGMGSFASTAAFLLLVAIVVPGILLLWLSQRLQREPAEPVSPLVAQALLRALAVRHGIVIAIGVLATVGFEVIVVHGHRAATIVGMYTLLRIVRLAMTRRAATRLEREGAHAERRGASLRVVDLAGSTSVRASDRAFVRARANALPRAHEHRSS